MSPIQSPPTPKRTFTPRRAMGAERVTQLLGDLAGAVVQVVGDDQNGWDCMLEFPPIDGTGLPADLAPPGLSILVQVKSSEKRGKSVRLSLSNALKYARHALPVFIVLVKTSDSLLTPTIYVKHVWTPLLQEFLKAVRQAEVDGKALHKAGISVTFDEDDRHDTDAAKHIAHVVDEIGANYATQKEALVDAAGFEGGVGVGSLTFDGIEPETLVDLMLGLVDSVDVSKFTYSEARFGIKNRKPTIDAMSGKISFEPTPVSDCTVMFRRAGSTMEIDAPGQVFTPGLPGLPKEFWKLRVKTDVVDFAISPDKPGSFRTNIDTGAERSLEELHRLTSFWAWAAEGDLNVEIWARGQRLASAEVTLTGNSEMLPWSRLQPALAVLNDLAPAARRPDGMTFQLYKLFNQLKDLWEFRKILTGDSLTTTLPDLGFERDFQPSRFVMPVHLELDGYLFVAIMDRPVQSAVLADGDLRLALGPPTRLHGAVLKGEAEDHRAYIAATVKRLPQAAEKSVMSYVPVVDGDPEGAD